MSLYKTGNFSLFRYSGLWNVIIIPVYRQEKEKKYKEVVHLKGDSRHSVPKKSVYLFSTSLYKFEMCKIFVLDEY